MNNLKDIFKDKKIKEKELSLFNLTKNRELFVQSLNINISNLNFQNENHFNLDVDNLNEVENEDIIVLKYNNETIIFSGIARISESNLNYTGNKTLKISLDFPLLSKKNFKKVILKDEFFLEQFASNSSDKNKSIMHVIGNRLGFADDKLKLDIAKSYYNAGMKEIAKLPFVLFKKGDRWIDELTTLLNSIGGYLFIDKDYNLVYKSYVDLKFKEIAKTFNLNEIHSNLPYKFSPGTNNGVKIEFDRFEKEELKEVFKSEKKIKVKKDEKLNLKLKYITDIVTSQRVKSLEVYYYENEVKKNISDYNKYITFNLTGNSGEIVINNTFGIEIFIDKLIIEAEPLMKYEDNSCILKNKEIKEELQEDFLTIGKNKYIQTFYMARSKAVENFYSKIKANKGLEIVTDFHPELELGDKVSVKNEKYCINKISHMLDAKNGYKSKFELVEVLDPDFLKIAWKELESITANKSGTDLDLVNVIVKDSIEETKKNIVNTANGFTEEIKEQLENQLAKSVLILEKKIEVQNSETQKIEQQIEEYNIEEIKKEVIENKSSISQTSDEIKLEIKNRKTIVNDLELKISKNTTNIEQTSENINLKVEEIKSIAELVNNGSHLISEINLSPEDITIHAKKIVIGNKKLDDTIVDIETISNMANSTANDIKNIISNGDIVINGNTVFDGDANIVSIGVDERTEIKAGNINFWRKGEKITAIKNVKVGTIRTDSVGSGRVIFNGFKQPMSVLSSIQSMETGGSNFRSIRCWSEIVDYTTNEYRFWMGSTQDVIQSETEVWGRDFTYTWTSTRLARYKQLKSRITTTTLVENSNYSYSESAWRGGSGSGAIETDNITFSTLPVLRMNIMRQENNGNKEKITQHDLQIECKLSLAGETTTQMSIRVNSEFNFVFSADVAKEYSNSTEVRFFVEFEWIENRIILSGKKERVVTESRIVSEFQNSSDGGRYRDTKQEMKRYWTNDFTNKTFVLNDSDINLGDGEILTSGRSSSIGIMEGSGEIQYIATEI
ncbi:MAG: hypothetical protein ACRC6K_00075 [Fusobacteriaceae bacterium]